MFFKVPPNLFWRKFDIFEAEKRTAFQATLFEPRVIGASCVAWTAEKNGKPKKDLRPPFSLLHFFWASKRNEEINGGQQNRIRRLAEELDEAK